MMNDDLERATDCGHGLTFETLAGINLSRALRWHKGGLQEWSISDWAVATAGECGEMCNAVKKLNRVEHAMQQKAGPQDYETALNAVKMEIGDTAVYLDLLAQRLGLTLEDCIRDTFNRISQREGFPERL